MKLDEKGWAVSDSAEEGMMLSPCAPENAAATWGPYFNAMFGPPRPVTPWKAWKFLGSGTNIVRRWWDQREELRAAYEKTHGQDPDQWPERHPAAVLDAVDFLAHPACLGCHWFEVEGFDVRESDRVELARQRALEHQRAWVS